jgi:hypothetical protein
VGAEVVPPEVAAVDVAVTDGTGTLDGTAVRRGESAALGADVLLSLGCVRLVGAAEVGAVGSWVVVVTSPRVGVLDVSSQPARQATSDAATPVRST